MQPVQKVENVLSHFEKTWETLFTSPVHLDSALSKLPVRYKSILAQIFPAILLRPTSLAEELGVGVPQGEPWRVSPEKLRRWRPAAMMADRLYASMVEGFPVVTPVREDFPSGMIQELEESWGGKVTDELVSILAGDPPLSLRVSRQVGVDALLEGLTAKKKLPVSVKRSELVPFGLRLSGYAPVLQTEWYEKGAFEIQDEGSQFMALFALWPEVFGKMLTTRSGSGEAHRSACPDFARSLFKE
jgi:hypothetical protein